MVNSVFPFKTDSGMVIYPVPSNYKAEELSLCLLFVFIRLFFEPSLLAKLSSTLFFKDSKILSHLQILSIN